MYVTSTSYTLFIPSPEHTAVSRGNRILAGYIVRQEARHFSVAQLMYDFKMLLSAAEAGPSVVVLLKESSHSLRQASVLGPLSSCEFSRISANFTQAQNTFRFQIKLFTPASLPESLVRLDNLTVSFVVHIIIFPLQNLMGSGLIVMAVNNMSITIALCYYLRNSRTTFTG